MLQKMTQVFGTCHSCGIPKWNSVCLPLPWTSPRVWEWTKRENSIPPSGSLLSLSRSLSHCCAFQKQQVFIPESRQSEWADLLSTMLGSSFRMQVWASGTSFVIQLSMNVSGKAAFRVSCLHSYIVFIFTCGIQFCKDTYIILQT